jgi:hypothetical protein
VGRLMEARWTASDRSDELFPIGLRLLVFTLFLLVKLRLWHTIRRFPNTVRADRGFHGLAGKFFRGGAFEDVLGRMHQRHLREAPPRDISEPYPQHC